MSAQIDLTTIQAYASILSDGEALDMIEMVVRESILKQHSHEIFYSKSEDCWRSFLPDDTKPKHRRQIKRKNRDDLIEAIVQFYLKDASYKSVVTLEQAYKDWMIYRRDYSAAKAKTIYENRNEWNKFFKDKEFAQLDVRAINPVAIIRFFREITKNRDITRKRLSNVRSVLNGIMGYCVEEGIIEHNPVRDVDFSKFVCKPTENQNENVFSTEEATKLLRYLANLEDEPYALAIQLSFYLFIRIGETKSIRWEDVNLEKRTVYLHTQALIERQLNDDMTFGGRQTVISSQMKGNTSKGFRTQYLCDEAVNILQRAKSINPDGEYVFQPNGHIMTTDTFNKRLKKYCGECNIPYYSSHKIRFFNASLAYDGKNLATISRLMGHSDISTTLHYLRNVNKGSDDSELFNSLGINKKENDSVVVTE